MHARFDDDEMNLTPEIAAALGYQPPRPTRPRRTPDAHHGAADPSGLPIILGIMALICMFCLGAAVTAHQQAPAQSQPQIPQESVRVAAEPPPGVAAAAAPSPVQQEIGAPAPVIESTTEIQERAVGQSSDVQANQGEVAQNADVQANQGEVTPDVPASQENVIPQHLPDDSYVGRVTTPTFASPPATVRLPRRSPWIYTGRNPSFPTGAQALTAGVPSGIARWPVRRFIRRPIPSVPYGPRPIQNRDLRRPFVVIRRIP